MKYHDEIEKSLSELGIEKQHDELLYQKDVIIHFELDQLLFLWEKIPKNEKVLEELADRYYYGKRGALKNIKHSYKFCKNALELNGSSPHSTDRMKHLSFKCLEILSLNNETSYLSMIPQHLIQDEIRFAVFEQEKKK